MHSGLLGTDVGALCSFCRIRDCPKRYLSKPAHRRHDKFRPFTTRAAENGSDDKHELQDQPQPKKTRKTSKGVDALNPVKLGRKSRAVLNDLLAAGDTSDKPRQSRSATTEAAKRDSSTDVVNPIKLGRKSRAVLDDLWEQFASITSPTKSLPSTVLDGKYRAGEGLTDFETPQAAFTTVLVVGATGKVGRVLLRKLLLRGYKVRALVRAGEDDVHERPPGIPQSVELVFGDLGDYAACRQAVEGADKVCPTTIDCITQQTSCECLTAGTSTWMPKYAVLALYHSGSGTSLKMQWLLPSFGHDRKV